MISILKRKESRRRVHVRIRRRVSGSAERPRLAVHFSGKHVYAQVIDDVAGRTLASVSTTEKGLDISSPKANVSTAEAVGKLVAQRAQSANILNVVFDRGGFQYHGKVKALADAARAGGLQF